jgi:hypothetical protein
MKQSRWYLIFGASLIALSLAEYLLQIIIFNRVQETAFYLLQDLAFIPIQVLIVTLILNNLLARRERQALLKKMNMVIGTFFTEVGTTLLRHFARFDQCADKMTAVFTSGDWSPQAFNQLSKYVYNHDYQIDSRRGNLAQLRTFLLSKRAFLLGLLENPNLLEHQSSTDMLLAVFHLTEELALREDISILPKADNAHLAGDIKRAYTLLVSEWLVNIQHLKQEYPYIFSLIVRTNPFDPSESPIFK